MIIYGRIDGIWYIVIWCIWYISYTNAMHYVKVSMGKWT